MCIRDSTYDEKIATIKAAQRAGLDVCSGGIIGLGESMEDRIDMALTARRLGIRSIPVNFLNPIKGTEFGNNRIIGEEEAVKCIALFRFILPGTFIRLAGGRGLLRDKGYSCFRSGANAAISGDMPVSYTHLDAIYGKAYGRRYDEGRDRDIQTTSV